MPVPPVRNLVERRVPHALAIYAGAAWGVVEFMSFLEQRYLFSPHWTDLCLLGFALLFPSVAVFAYHHGRPGADRWARSEKIGIPLNVAAAVVVLFAVFSGRELGAVTHTITLEDERGRVVEREVPKAEFRKRVAIFPFESPAADTVRGRLGHGLPLAIQMDLSQDLFVDAHLALEYRERLREAGFEDGMGVPLALQREIAERAHLGHFLAGSVRAVGDSVTAEVSLFDAATGSRLERRVYTGADVFDLADRISVRLRRDLEVPARHIEETTDLPAAELLTGSPAAWREYVGGFARLVVRDDWAGAAAAFESAVAIDPGFAMAQYALGNVYIIANRTAEAAAPLQAAMDNLYRVPERLRFRVKSDYYFARGDFDRAWSVLAMRAEVFPDDAAAFEALARVHVIRGRPDSAIAAYRRVLELDPRRNELLHRIGALYEDQGDYEEALAAYRRYADRFPDDARAFTALAQARAAMGELDAARADLEKALLLAAGDVDILTRRAGLERDAGRFDAAAHYLEDAMTASRTAEDSLRVLEGLREFHEFRGRMDDAIRHLEAGLDVVARVRPPFLLLIERLGGIATYIRAGRPDEARRVLAEVETTAAPPLDALVGLGRMVLHLELGHADSAAAAVASLEEAARATGIDALRWYAVRGRARVAEIRGDCEAALDGYRDYLEYSPASPRTEVAVGRCLRRLGRTEEAERAIRRLLERRPADPLAHAELARVFADRDDPAAAADHLRRALEAWSDASAGFAPARTVREELARIARGDARDRSGRGSSADTGTG